MPKHLIVDGHTWVLPGETDIKRLHDDLKLRAMEKGQVIDVEIEVQPEPLKRGTLFINGRVVSTAAVVDAGD